MLQVLHFAERPAVDVASPISSVIPSLDGAVLGALAGTTAPLNLTAVHRLTGRGSLSGVRRVLVRLVGAGIVHEVPGGYVLNREHVAAGAIEELANLWAEVFERIRTSVGDWGATPEIVAIFGSAARRDGDEASDIDLLVVSDAEETAEQAADLAEQVASWTGNPARVLTLSRSDLRRMRRAKEPILREWERDLVVIVGERQALKAAS